MPSVDTLDRMFAEHHGVDLPLPYSRKRLAESVVREIERLLAEGMAQNVVADLVAASPTAVGSIAHGRHYWQQTPERRARIDKHTSGGGAPEYVPTPSQIAAECDAIQAGWSRRDRRKAKRQPRWVAPVCSVSVEVD